MAWVSLVFGAIQECSEKGVIIGDCGKRIVRDTDSLVSRQSSFGRIDPTSQTTPTALVADADLWLGIVPFSSQPSDTRFSVPGGGRRHRPHKHTEKAPSPSVFKKTSQSNNAPVPMDSGPTNPSSHTTHDIPNLDSRGSRLLQVEIPVSPDSSHGHSSTNSSIRPGGGRVHYIPAPIRKAISDHTWFALGRARLPRDPTPGDCQPLLDASISGGLLEEHGGSMSTRFSDPSTSPIHLPTNPNDLSGSAGSVTPSQESSHFDPSRPPTPILAQTPGAVESLRRSSYQSTEIDEKGSEIEEYSFIVTPAPPFLPDIPSGEFEVSWPPNASTPAMLPALPPSHPSSRSSRVTFLDLQS
ncbi:hypothetical protein JAAARDRAFT_414526 [Jaapia argillacea MUCL 33604]|uniref:Uncharacterized protein n=1 Tax=Jaapia argillacea MUCL 33604 TaxID=933084 RepID=A0A067PRB8_9AGAM|nr:hypothetical protein JAAARDRAFT_414526 [Jaapia argillacea MUCL 33604]